VRTWLTSSLLTCIACSPGSVPSGSLPESADFLPVIADSLEEPAGDHPQLVLRCEEGIVAAYLVVGTSPEVGLDSSDGRAVRVQFDSTQSC
jgi:hypothetical protein